MKSLTVEELLKSMWINGLIDNNLSTVDGQNVTIVHRGYPNYDSGPDFLSARIYLEDKLWVGNVEIHAKASDWLRHGHNTDKAYDSVILHVVNSFDMQIYRTNGEAIPTVEISLDEGVIGSVEKIFRRDRSVPCAENLDFFDTVYIRQVLDKMVIERLERRREKIFHELVNYDYKWEQVFMILLFSSFGMGINSVPFELLAKSIDYKIIYENRDDLRVLESLLYGQAGLLNEKCEHEYFRDLLAKYEFLRVKYRLIPMQREIWKFLRLRPNNFPTIRISQLANFLAGVDNILDFILESDYEQIRKKLAVNASEYWQEHYRFCDEPHQKKRRSIGAKALDSIFINAIVPFIYSYARYQGDEKLVEKSLEFLHGVKFEDNRITRYFKNLNLSGRTAFDSQGIIELYTAYCSNFRCLECPLGVKLLIHQAFGKDV